MKITPLADIRKAGKPDPSKDRFDRYLDASRKLSFSPDGEHIAFELKKVVKIHDAASGKEIRSIPFPQKVHAVVYAPDGDRLLVQDTNTTAVVDPTNGKTLAKVEGVGDGAVAVSPDGKTFVACGYSGTLWLCGYNGKVLRKWENSHGVHDEYYHMVSEATYEAPNPLYDVAFSPDGKRIASLGGNDPLYPFVHVWSVSARGNKPSAKIETARHVWFCSGDRLVVPGKNRTRVVPLGSGKERTLAGTPMAVSGTWAATTEGVVDLVKGRTRAAIPKNAHKGPMAAMALSIDAKRLVTSGQDGAIKAWTITS